MSKSILIIYIYLFYLFKKSIFYNIYSFNTAIVFLYGIGSSYDKSIKLSIFLII